MTRSLVKRVTKLHRTGWPDRKIAKELGLTVEAVRAALENGPRR